MSFLKPKTNTQSTEELQWLRDALHSAHTAVYEWDIENDIITWSDNVSELLGINGMDISASERFTSLIEGAERDNIDKQRILLNGADDITFQLEYSMALPQGNHMRIMESGRRICDDNGKLTHIVGVLAPQENSATAATPSHEEYQYPTAFMQALDEIVKNARASDHPKGALMVLSIENMPMIVSGYGHEESEKIFQDLCKEMKEHITSQESLFRIQRDQFAIISPQREQKDQVALMNHLTRMLKQYGQKYPKPLHIMPMVSTIDFSETIAEQPYCTGTTVIDRAYVDLRSSSERMALSTVDLMDGSPQSSLKQMEMVNYLHEAIHQDRLRLAYQPIIRSSDGDVSHYECLLRLVGEDGTLTSAGALIPVAERMGLIDVIDQLVLEMVVEDLLRSPDVTLAFNVSNLTTNDAEWLDTLQRVLEATPEIAPRMIVEITETAAQRNLAETAYFVASIQAMGCKVALDDFGSGYTSFRQLKTLSCDMIKIDGQFVRDLEVNNDNQFFVKTLLDFVQGFGLEAVAECVETGESAKMLMELGVHYMQGYYFSKPLTHRDWLKEGEYQSGM